MTKTARELDREIRAATDQETIRAFEASGKARVTLGGQPGYDGELEGAYLRESMRKHQAKLDKAREKRQGKAKEYAAGKAVGKVTDLNLFTLAEFVAQHGGHVRMPNRFDSTSRNGIKRCIDGGYATVDGSELVLTPTGKAAVADYFVQQIAREEAYLAKPNPDPYYAKRSKEKLDLFTRAADVLGSRAERF